jgi:DNA-binding GntR family transcriptional regulator
MNKSVHIRGGRKGCQAGPDPAPKHSGVAAPNAPAYARIANDLVQRIVAGQYAVGSLLPKEIELAEQYGVSRHTMREALRRLTDTGLVSRRRRAGTEVVAAKPISYRQPVSSIDDLLQYGEGTRIRVLKQSKLPCDAELARMLDSREGREWLRVETMRSYPGDPRPICLTTNYLAVEVKRIAEDEINAAGGISSLLESRYGVHIASIEQSIQAVRLDKREARLLRAKPGAPGLRAVRRYYDEGARLVELSDALHAGERFTYVTRLKRNG